MSAAVPASAVTSSAALGRLEVELRSEPVGISIVRAGETVVRDIRFWSQSGGGADRLITLTEGVIPEEERGEPEPLEGVTAREASPAWLRLDGRMHGGRGCRVDVSIPERDRVVVELWAEGDPFRIGAGWVGFPEERLTGLGARHRIGFDQRGRTLQLGADRRYTGPDCPPELLEGGGIPQGDYAPVPWLLSNRGWAVWIETRGPGVELGLGEPVTISTRAAAGPLRLHFICDPTPVARLRHYLRLTGRPALLPEWGYGFWKSRDVYEHERDVLDDFNGHERHAIPLDALVLDSPWETQYNTWRFNPHQFPDPPGLISRLRAAGVRTVVWTTPWVNVDSAEGQRPPDSESERLHRAPAHNYDEGASAGHFVWAGDGSPYLGLWWMGRGSPVDLSSSAARRWWKDHARRILELGVEGIKADDGEGYYLPPEARLADGRDGAEAAWAYPRLYLSAMQEALDEVHPDSGVLFARSGWSGTQGLGVTWGGDQASDFWSLRALVAATLTAAASGISNWSHDVGGYLGKRLTDRCPSDLLLRWAQFGCFTPLMQAHGRFAQEPWRYHRDVLDVYRAYVLLHERLVPYVRAAAATAARTGLPIIRPLCLADPDDPRGWTLADAYGYGPALWVAPVLEPDADVRRVYLPRGEWIDTWSGEPAEGGREVIAETPTERIPVWVRRGSIVPTYPAEHVASGLGDVPEAGRPLELTLWGRPPLGRTATRLTDGTAIRWAGGRWSVTPPRQALLRERGL
ncbi:MAG: glycoside hydrolase family 31 protein [Solirubrobacterales bacterium]